MQSLTLLISHILRELENAFGALPGSVGPTLRRVTHGLPSPPLASHRSHTTGGLLPYHRSDERQLRCSTYVLASLPGLVLICHPFPLRFPLPVDLISAPRARQLLPRVLSRTHASRLRAHYLPFPVSTTRTGIRCCVPSGPRSVSQRRRAPLFRALPVAPTAL